MNFLKHSAVALSIATVATLSLTAVSKADEPLYPKAFKALATLYGQNEEMNVHCPATGFDAIKTRYYNKLNSSKRLSDSDKTIIAANQLEGKQVALDLWISTNYQCPLVQTLLELGNTEVVKTLDQLDKTDITLDNAAKTLQDSDKTLQESQALLDKMKKMGY